MEHLLRIQEQVWEDTLLGGEEPVLYCRCTLPSLSRLEKTAQTRINRYYQHVEERFQHWCRSRLFPQAERLRREARITSHPFEPWSTALSFSQEILEDHSLSITLTYRRSQEGKILFSTQHTDVWELKRGFLVNPSS